MRFGFTPLYLTYAEVAAAAAVVARVFDDRLWDRSEFRARAAVT